MISSRGAPTSFPQTRAQVGCVAQSDAAPAMAGFAVGALARFVNILIAPV